ncbi:hypothetical protein Daus18300_011422 [Diaporthe australafricana]|uniref:Uncharacterized protein n=1 Tax=Diaporthe australafricana TaxID=127596 RepID=A0ABR3W6Q2_9PEZI
MDPKMDPMEEAKKRLEKGKKATPGSYTSLINNVDEIDQLLVGYLQLQDETVKSSATTGTLTPTKFQHHVQACYDAIKSTAKAEDAFQGNGGDTQRIPSTATKFLNGLNPFEIQLIAGLLVKTVFKMQSGELCIPGWPQLSTLKYEKFASFDNRMSAVVTSLEHSKALCKNLFSGHLTWEKRIAMQPAAEAKTKGTNNIVNAKRNDQVSYAKKNMPEAGRRGSSTAGMDNQGENNEAEPTVATMRPKKKARSAAQKNSIPIKPWGRGSVATGSAKTSSTNTSNSKQNSQDPVSPDKDDFPAVPSPAAIVGSPVPQYNNQSPQIAGPSFDQQSPAFQYNSQLQDLAPNQSTGYQTQPYWSQQGGSLDLIPTLANQGYQMPGNRHQMAQSSDSIQCFPNHQVDDFQQINFQQDNFQQDNLQQNHLNEFPFPNYSPPEMAGRSIPQSLPCHQGASSQFSSNTSGPWAFGNDPQLVPQANRGSFATTEPGFSNPMATSQPPSAGESSHAFNSGADAIATRRCQMTGLEINPDAGFDDMYYVPVWNDSGDNQEAETEVGQE